MGRMMGMTGKFLALALLAPLLVGASATPAAAAGSTVVNEVAPGHQVAVGQTTTLTSTLVVDDGLPLVPNYVDGFIPDAFEIVSVTSGAGSCGFSGQRVTCSGMLFPGGGTQQVVVELLPLHRAYDQPLALSWTDEWGWVSGPPAIVDVIDPTVTADVHAELAGPDLAMVGEPFSVTGTIVSAGSVGVADVTATVSVDPSLQLTSVTWGQPAAPCPIAGGVATCSIGDLGPWTAVPFRADVSPLVADPDAGVSVSVATTSPVDAPDPYPDTAVHPVEVVDPITDVTVWFPPWDEEYVLGDGGGFVVYAGNDGPAEALGTQIVVDVPANLTITGAALRSWGQPPNATGCTVSGQTVTCGMGDLPAGGSFDATVSVVPQSLDPGQLQATVATTTPEFAPDPTPNTVTKDYTVIEPWLASSIAFDTPGTAVAGQPVTLRARPNVSGPLTPVDATVVVDVPSGWTVTSATENHTGGDCAVVAAEVTCELDDLDQRAVPRAVTVTAVPDVSGPATVTATLSTPHPDDTPADDVATLELDVLEPFVDLEVTIGNTFVHRVGQDAGYHVRAHNRGLGEALDVVVTAPVPPAATFVSVQAGGTGTCEVVDDVATCTVPTLAPGASFTVSMTVRHSGDLLEVPVEGWVASSSPEPDPDPHPNHATHTIDVVGDPDLVRGTVEGPTGTPLAGVTVRFYEPGAFLPARTVTTDAQGGYVASLGEATPRTYAVHYVAPTGSGLANEWWDDVATRTAATTLEVGRWSEVHVLDVRLEHPNPVGSDVSGTVSVEEGPVEGGVVAAYELGDGWQPTATATVGPDGSYAIDDLPVGTYSFAFLPPAGVSRPVVWSGGSFSRSGATRTPVDGSGAPVSLGDQALVSWASLTGTVTDGSGTPMAGVGVSVFRPEQVWVPQYTAITAADGTWTVPEALPGDYQVLFRPPAGSGVANQWFDGSALRVTSTTIPLASGAVATDVDATLVAWASISGRVTGPGGEPVAGVSVSAYGPDDRFVPSRRVTTGADGRYRIPWLWSDDYSLRFGPPAGSGLAPEWFDDVTLRSAATAVVVAEGAQLAGYDAVLAPVP